MPKKTSKQRVPQIQLLHDILYMHVVSYFWHDQFEVPAWGGSVLGGVAEAFPPRRVMGVLFGPHVEDPGLSAWPRSKHGVRSIELKHGPLQGALETIRDAPLDTMVLGVFCNRQGSLDKLCDTGWGVTSDKPSVWHYTAPYHEVIEGDAADRAVVDSIARVKANCLLLTDDDRARALIDRTIAIASEHASHMYSFVTIQRGEEDAMGMLYDSTIALGNFLPEYLKRERAWWAEGVDRRRVARGAYWGNLWCATLVERMRTTGAIAEIEKIGQIESSKTPVGGVRVQPLAHGSLFVTLTPRALDAHPEDANYAVYIQRRDRLAAILSKHQLMVVA